MPAKRVNGVELYYELHGPDKAPVLVLNNGILMSTASWAFQKEALSQNYRLLLYDCRGQGQSEHPAEAYSMDLHAQDLAGLLDTLEIEAAHIAGISYGGEVAQAFALKYPRQTRSLILADTVSQVDPSLRIIVQSWLDAAQEEPARRAEAFFHATAPWNFSAEFIAANPALMEDALRRYAFLDYPAVMRLIQCFFGVDFRERLDEIHCPTCILYGEKDLLKGRPYAEILHAAILDSEMHVLLKAGHASCIERPKEFNTILLGFLSKVEASGGL